MDQEQQWELGREIWRLRKAGYDRIRILEELAIFAQQLEDCLSVFESRLPADVARVMENCFRLDNERIEEVIECWMPIALGDGSPADEMNEADFDLQLKASYGVLAAINQRHKIMLASQPEKTSVQERSVDLLVWLQQNGNGKGLNSGKRRGKDPVVVS
jgi:hypothetical protein